MGAWVYIRRCLTFGVKIKLRNIWGYARYFFLYVYSICSLYLAACTFAPISKFGPLPFKNPRCAPAGANQKKKEKEKDVGAANIFKK